MSVRFPSQLIVEQFPWLNDFLPYLSILQELWHQYQSLVILVGLVLVWRRLRAERIMLSERIDTLGQIVKATRDETEVSLAQASADPEQPQLQPDFEPLRNWQHIRAVWREARDRLELLIEQISRSRVRAKYSRMDRYTYRGVISALETDGYLTRTVSDKLRAMDTVFNTVKFRPNAITDQQVIDFNQLYELPNGKLPKLPDEDVLPEEAPPLPGVPQERAA